MRHALVAIVLLTLGMAGPGSIAAQDRDAFEGRCEDGELPACNILGLMYETGAGVGRDVRRATEIYGRICDAGESSGCTSLGLLLEHGDGVPQDHEGAAARYGTACTAGDQFGCDLLAALEHEGPITEEQEFFKTGRVGDAKNASMLADALVDVPRLGVRGLTDAQGRITLGRVPEGYYDIRAEALGYEVMRGTVVVPGYSEFVVLLNPMDWQSPSAWGRIDGTVTDEAGTGIASVDVSIVGQSRRRATTNQDGHYSLTTVDAGLAEVRFSRLGYATRETMLIVQPSTTARIDATMATDAVDLDPIEVTVEERSAYLERSGFYRRQRMGQGRQLTREDFHGEGRTPGQLLDELPGIRIARDIFFREFVYGTRPGGECQFDVYLDGSQSRDGNVNWATPDEIEGIEVYLGREVPPEYSRLGNCGIVLLWTVRP